MDDAMAAGDSASETLDKLERAYREHHASVLRVCRRFFQEPMDVEDAAQETFLRTAGKLPAVTGDLSAYFAVVARNVCRSELRRRAREATRQTPAPEPAHAEDEYLSMAFTRQLWERMSGRDRQLLAHVLAGYQYDETAARTGLSPKAVSVGLSRARRRAREGVKGLQGVVILPGASLRGMARRGSAWVNRQRLALGEQLFQGIGSQAALVGAMGLMIAAVPVLTPSVLAGNPGAVGSSTRSAAVAPQSGDSAPAPLAGTAGPTQKTSPATHAHTITARAVAGSILAPGVDANHQDAAFSSISPSPSYASDHTVYASGILVTGCGRPTGCPILFRTTDGGASWQPVAAAQYAGGAVLPSPDYGTDRTLLAAGPAGLQVSRDAGSTFTTVVPTPGPVAVIRGPKGHPLAVIGGATLLFYDIASGTLAAGPAMPAGVAPADGIAFAGDAGHVVVSAVTPDAAAATGEDGAVVDCDATSCRTVLRAPDVAPMHLAVSPTYDRDGVVIAYGASSVYMSADQAGSFHLLVSTPGAVVIAVDLAPDLVTTHRLHLALQSPSTGQTAIRTIDEAGRTLAESSGPTSRRVAAIAELLDGRLLVGLQGSSGGRGVDFGIRCSLDSAHSWLTAC